MNRQGRTGGSMKTRPILFSGPMVRAILESKKCQTRRVMKPQPVLNNGFYEWAGAGWDDRITRVTPMLGHSLSVRCPYGIPGDHLWVRETWLENALGEVLYRVDMEGYETEGMGWKSPIFMPRAASRITLEITDVRVERVQGISEADALAEGCRDLTGWTFRPLGSKEPMQQVTAVDWYRGVWENINGEASWDLNPWVWVVSFQRVTP